MRQEVQIYSPRCGSVSDSTNMVCKLYAPVTGFPKPPTNWKILKDSIFGSKQNLREQREDSFLLAGLPLQVWHFRDTELLSPTEGGMGFSVIHLPLSDLDSKTLASSLC